MANEVVAAFNAVYPDGPASDPYEPKKSEIRGIGPVIQALIDQLFSLVGVGFQLKTEVRAASTTNVTLSSMSNGASFGGVTLATGQRFAPIGQTNAAENGIYIAQASGAPVRASDADQSSEIKAMMFFVTEGTHAGKVFGCTEAGTIVVGTTALPFRLFLDMSSLNATLASKASQAALDALTVVVGTKASQTALDAAVADIATKASQLQVDDMAGLGLLDTAYADGWVDENNFPLLMFRHDGTVDVLDTYPLLDGDFFYAEVDENFNVLRGIYHNGEAYPNTQPTPSVETIPVIEREGDIVIQKGATRAQITFTGYNAGPVSDGDFVSYILDSGTSLSRRTEEVKASTSLSGSVTAVQHYLLHGQSLSIGGNSGDPVHTSAVRAGRAVMYNAGVRVFGGASPSLPLVPESLYSWINLAEASFETPGSGLGFTVTAAGRLPSTSAALLSATGKGGAPYSDLKKGTGPYNNLLETVRRARVMASINGRGYHVRAVPFIHGEADRAASKAVYQGDLVEIQSDLTTDINALTGDTGEVLLSVDQISDWTDYGDASSQVPFAQLQAALDNPTKIICVGPKYHLPTTDGTHLTAASYGRWGSYHGRAIEQHKAGTPWLPLYCTGYSRAGAVITLNMHVPVGPLVVDTTAVTDPGNKGIVWNQTGGTARTISSVAVSGSDIVVTLSGDPGSFSTASIGIAYPGTAGAEAGPTTGPRSNFRDSATDTDIDGNAMPNWACHQLITTA